MKDWRFKYSIIIQDMLSIQSNQFSGTKETMMSNVHIDLKTNNNYRDIKI